MSITEELRKFAWKECPSKFLERVIGIADDIDAAHQKAMDEWKAKDGKTWLHGYSECHAELMEGNEAIAADLEKAGWIRLPKDADGVTIRIGDKLDGYNKAIEVVELRYGRSGWILISRDGNAYSDTAAFAHVKPDSWEAIIEAAASYGDKRLYTGTQGDKAIIAELVERCKRLAGDA